MHVNWKDFNVGLQGLIFEHLQEKAQKIKEDFNVCDKNVRSKIIDQRGDGVLEREGLLLDFKWCTTEVEFSRSILVWHLATEFCYLVDKHRSDVSTEYETSRCLSEYMMYLLVQEYQLTLRKLWDLKDRGPDDEEYQCTLRVWHNSESRRYGFQRIWKTEKSVLSGVYVLARQLLSLGPDEKRWRMINEVWIEMVAYAAAHCPWKEHTQQLRRGGELLTHVSLLMLHLGLSAQYEYHESDSPLQREHECEERVLKRMLELEKREVEQLRSSLTASTPQQGIDSLPRSLPAQTDGQGTGQPPSNNEISLSME
ncbi:hypothetical protein NC652_035337 [Populus alba x Populus x berolinensis]|nr:hypothetical protein NC652_035337 [Populus alba x Populus x berolinensis]